MEDKYMRIKKLTTSYLQENDSTRLAENLRILLNNHHLNTNQLAHALNIPMMTIRRLVSGETTDPRISTLKLIADYFNLSVDCLLGDADPTHPVTSQSSKSRFVPILDWETTEKMNTLNDLDLRKWKEWQSIPVMENNIISSNAFALRSRPSMSPRFPQGTIFVIEPEATPMDGDIVLVKINSIHRLTLRELIVDPPDYQLHPVVIGSNMLKYNNQDHKFVGVNILTLLYNRSI